MQQDFFLPVHSLFPFSSAHGLKLRDPVFVLPEAPYIMPEYCARLPIKGPEGNIEYLLYLQNHPEGEDGPVIYEEMPVDPVKTVEEAHAALDKE